MPEIRLVLKTETSGTGVKTTLEGLKATEQAARAANADLKTIAQASNEAARASGMAAIEAAAQAEALRGVSEAARTATGAISPEALQNVSKWVEALAPPDLAALTGEVQQIAAAFEVVGGASALTEGQFDKLAKRLAEIEAAGVKLPPALGQITQGLAQTAEVAGKSEAADRLLSAAKGELGAQAQSLAGHLGPLGGALASIGPAGLVAAAGVGAVVIAVGGAAAALFSWGGALVESASKLADLSEETQLSLSTLQEFAHVETQVGAGQGTMAAAVGRASRVIAKGGDLVRSALGALGLSLSDMRSMDPESQFNAIAKGLAGVTDAGTRAAIAVQLFGQDSAMLRVVEADVEGLRSEAHKMGLVLGDETVRQFDALGDESATLKEALTALKNSIVLAALGGNSAAPAIRDLAMLVSESAMAVREGSGAFQDFYRVLTGSTIAEQIHELRTMIALIRGAQQFASSGGTKYDFTLPSMPASSTVGNTTKPVAAGGFGFGDDSELKLIRELQAEIAKLQAQHQGAFASMRADLAATYQSRLRDAEGMRGATAAVRAWYAEALKAGEAQVINSLIGPRASELAVQLRDLTTAIGLVGGPTAMANSQLDATASKLLALARDSVPGAVAAFRELSAEMFSRGQANPLIDAERDMARALQEPLLANLPALAQEFIKIQQSADDTRARLLAALGPELAQPLIEQLPLLSERLQKLALEADRLRNLGRTLGDVEKEAGDVRAAFDRAGGDLSKLTTGALLDLEQRIGGLVSENGELEESFAGVLDAIAKEKAARSILSDSARARIDHENAIRDALREQAEILAEQIRYQNSFVGILNSVPGILGALGGSLGALGQGLGDGFSAIEQLGSAKTWDGVAQGAAGLVKAFKSVTDSASGAMRAFGGAAMGAKLGHEFGGAWGAAIGAVIGGVAGLFRKPGWVKAGAEAGRVLGFAVSKELAKEIEKTAKELKIDFKSATLLTLDKAIAESGKGVGAFGSQIGELFNGIASGSVPAGKGVEQLGTLFSKARAEAEGIGKTYSGTTVAMIRAARQTGTTFAGMTEAVNAGLEKVARGWDKIALSLKDGKVVSGLDPSLALSLDEGKLQAYARAQGEFFTESFWAAAGEMGIVQAADAFRKSFASMRDSFGELLPKDTVSALLGPIERVMALTAPGDDSGPAALFRGAAEAAEGLRDVVDGLAESGYLTARSLENAGILTRNAFEQALAGGATAEEAMLAVKPALQAQLDAARAYGYELDENTASLVAQAETMGMAFKVDPLMEMVDILKSIAVALGAEVPASAHVASESLRSTGLAGQDSAREVTKAWEGASQHVATQGDITAAAAARSFDAVTEAGIASAEATIVQWARVAGTIGAGLDDLARRHITVPVSFYREGEFPQAGGAQPYVPDSVPGAAYGAMVGPTPGGQLYNVGEGGRAEVIAPVAAFMGDLRRAIVGDVASMLRGAGRGPDTVNARIAIGEQDFASTVIRLGRTGHAGARGAL